MTKAAVSGPWQHRPPTLPTHATWFDAPCGFIASSICDRELQVFYPFFWLHSLYFPVCSLSSSSTSEGSSALLSAVTGKIEICVFWAAVSVLMLVECLYKMPAKGSQPQGCVRVEHLAWLTWYKLCTTRVDAHQITGFSWHCQGVSRPLHTWKLPQPQSLQKADFALWLTTCTA